VSPRAPVAIVGAGPYALATAAHLRAAGVEPRVFGEPMGFWETMPKGMFLRSYRSASSIADPERRLSLDGYEAAVRRSLPSPLPLEDFIAYGRWFQQQAVPEVDRRRVQMLRGDDGGFSLALDDGDTLEAKRLVVAAGIEPFAWAPEMFGELPPELVTHTSQHRVFDRFQGKRVLVVGAGQSALESAALLHEADADVEVLARARGIRYLRGEHLYTRSGVLRDVIYPPHGVGPPGLNVVMGTPALFRALPRGLSGPLARRSIRPAAAAWLRERLAAVPITTERVVESLAADDGHVRLRLDDGSERSADHLILGTGYRVDIRRYAFLDRPLAESISTVNGYPVLSRSFESSVRGMYFLGAPAAASAGPGMRFVSHTGPAALAVTQSIIRDA
jgi:cation diffusion facilitator CzcD-associated flavoprotein CzcO